jgi:hypothetical protein
MNLPAACGGVLNPTANKIMVIAADTIIDTLARTNNSILEKRILGGSV